MRDGRTTPETKHLSLYGNRGVAGTDVTGLEMSTWGSNKRP